MVELPKGVHRVVSRGREYFYWSPGRATKHAAKPVRLPNDPTDPKLWVALRDAQGQTTAAVVTVGDVIDRYITSSKFLGLTDGTRTMYAKPLKVLRAGFGDWDAAGLRPNHLREVMEGMADMPGAANNLLAVARALSLGPVPGEDRKTGTGKGNNMSAWWLLVAFGAGAAFVYACVIIWLISNASRFWR